MYSWIALGLVVAGITTVVSIAACTNPPPSLFNVTCEDGTKFDKVQIGVSGAALNVYSTSGDKIAVVPMASCKALRVPNA